MNLRFLELCKKGSSNILYLNSPPVNGLNLDLVCDPDSLLEESLAYAETLKQGAAISVAVVKSCVNRGIEESLGEGLALEMKGLEQLLKTADAREGVTAFLEKRKPVFYGR